ncbi:MAG: hypothetical protein Kow00124_06470 [Anaerolineae bacterium]
MMSDRRFGDPNEPEEARERIERIKRGGQQQPQPTPEPDYYPEPGPSQPTPPGMSRVGRVPAAEPPGPAPAPEPKPAPGRGTQAIMFIAGVVGIGIIVVLALVLLSGVLTGGGPALPFGATDTPTPTATFTPTPTPTETPTPTPTPPPPRLSLPPLTCIFQSGTGCFDYCQAAENAQECQAAKDFVAAQGADPDAWFTCLSPGPGANVGNPQECLVQAWYAAQQP